MHHHGTDIRHKGENWLYARLAQRIFVFTPDLLERSRDAIWVSNPRDIKMYPSEGVSDKPSNDMDPIKILHAPSRNG
jgi:hypothetical protein